MARSITPDKIIDFLGISQKALTALHNLRTDWIAPEAFGDASLYELNRYAYMLGIAYKAAYPTQEARKINKEAAPAFAAIQTARKAKLAKTHLRKREI